jgi:hypothetical protein
VKIALNEPVLAEGLSYSEWNEHHKPPLRQSESRAGRSRPRHPGASVRRRPCQRQTLIYLLQPLSTIELTLEFEHGKAIHNDIELEEVVAGRQPWARARPCSIGRGPCAAARRAGSRTTSASSAPNFTRPGELAPGCGDCRGTSATRPHSNKRAFHARSHRWRRAARPPELWGSGGEQRPAAPAAQATRAACCPGDLRRRMNTGGGHRQATLNRACAAHLERFARRPRPPALPEVAWINQLVEQPQPAL